MSSIRQGLIFPVLLISVRLSIKRVVMKSIGRKIIFGDRGDITKDPFYIDAQCAFVSEIGYHGCPNLESLKKMMTEDCVYPWVKDHEWNDEWVTKSVRRFPVWGKTFDRNNLMINQVRLLFGEVPSKLEDFIFASQSVQAEAMKYFY